MKALQLKSPPGKLRDGRRRFRVYRIPFKQQSTSSKNSFTRFAAPKTTRRINPSILIVHGKLFQKPVRAASNVREHTHSPNHRNQTLSDNGQNYTPKRRSNSYDPHSQPSTLLKPMRDDRGGRSKNTSARRLLIHQSPVGRRQNNAHPNRYPLTKEKMPVLRTLRY